MNFTRDPIIETVITPREGCKLVVRSSKGANQEDYFVDALEVVSFGHSFFFRSLERPKSFLVPVSDYEIFESKEPKLVLKNAPESRSIKIGGGREMAPRPSREAPIHEMREDEQTVAPGSALSVDRKHRDNKRRRGRRGGRDRNDSYAPQEGAPAESFSRREEPEAASVEASEEKSSLVEAPKEKAPSFISKLFPPPTTLIKDTLSRYKSIGPVEEEHLSRSDQDSVSLEENGSLEDVNGNSHSDPRSDEDMNEEE